MEQRAQPAFGRQLGSEALAHKAAQRLQVGQAPALAEGLHLEALGGQPARRADGERERGLHQRDVPVAPPHDVETWLQRLHHGPAAAQRRRGVRQAQQLGQRRGALGEGGVQQQFDVVHGDGRARGGHSVSIMIVRLTCKIKMVGGAVAGVRRVVPDQRRLRRWIAVEPRGPELPGRGATGPSTRDRRPALCRPAAVVHARRDDSFRSA